MRILHLADRLTDRGGAYWHLLGVIAHQSRDHAVHLAVGRDDGNVMAACPTSVVEGLDARRREPVDLESVVRELSPDVIHVHTVMNPAALERLGGLRGITKVVTVQDHRYFCPGRGKLTADREVCAEPMARELCTKCFAEDAYYRDVYRLTAERLRAIARFRVVVLSRYMKQELVTAGLSPDRIAVVPPFVHGLDAGAGPGGLPCVLFVGRLVESKGVLDAVDVWKRSGVSLPLVVAGTGPLRDAIRVPGVELLGWVARDRLSSLYRRAACVLMPSRWQEPFGIVGLEALTMGAPVAAWRSGGVAEWHAGPGLAVWGDRDALARELRAAPGRRVDKPRGFEPAILMRKLLEVYS